MLAYIYVADKLWFTTNQDNVSFRCKYTQGYSQSRSEINAKKPN